MADAAARTLARELLGKVGLRPEHVRQPLSARDFRRPAPARQHRARAGAVAAAGDPRRGGVGARQVGRGAGAQSAGRSQARVRPDLSLHQPRSQRGALHLRPRAGDVSRRSRRTRPGRSGVGSRRRIPIRGRCWRRCRRPIRISRTETPPISGDPPNPIDPPSGCRFHTRCPFAEPLCANATPKLTALDTMGHQAACYMAIPGSGHSRAPAQGSKRGMTRPAPKEIKAIADVAGVPVERRESPPASPIRSARPSTALRRSPARCRSISSRRVLLWPRSRNSDG